MATKPQTIINRAKRKGIKTNAIKQYKQALEYIKEHKKDIDYEQALQLANERFLKENDLTKMFDMRKKSNKARIENIKKTMYSTGFFDSISDITNQDIIDYIENIQSITDNINIMNNLASEQVGDIYLYARNKNISTNELQELIIKAQSQTNTYGRFTEVLYDLIEEF